MCDFILYLSGSEADSHFIVSATRPHTPPIARIVQPQSTPMRPGFNRQHTFGTKGTPAPLLGDDEEEREGISSDPASLSAPTPAPSPTRMHSSSPLPQIVLAPSINVARPPLVRHNSSDHVQTWLLNTSSQDRGSREIEVEGGDIFGKEVDIEHMNNIDTTLLSAVPTPGLWSSASSCSRFTLEHDGTPPLLRDLPDSSEWHDKLDMSASAHSLTSPGTPAPSDSNSSVGSASTPRSPVSAFNVDVVEDKWDAGQTVMKTYSAKALGMFNFTEERRGSFGQLLTGRIGAEEGESEGVANVGIAY